MVVGLDRNSATLMPYYIYIYSRHSPETRFSSTHAYVYDRPARIKPCFVLMCSREREREIDIQKGMEIQRSPPLFSRTSRDKGGEGGFFVLTFASFQRNEPRGKWKSRTNGVEDNRPWKRPKRPLLSSCRPEYRLFSFLLEEEEEEEGRSVYSPSFSPVEILLYDAATTSAIRIFIRTTLKALT